ncbi:MAG TPA: SRPBCC family protein [Thermoplasmata archaeon]|nr:SRPBCC family protein [Thermoplasmata archaeon]
MAYDYEFLLRVHAPRATVFEKLLRIEHLARWFCGWCRIEPKVGGTFRFGGETCIVLPESRGWETTIDEGETLRRFAFTWPIRDATTRVAYELEDAGPEASLLHARHSGVPLKDAAGGTIQDAWRMCLGNLKSIAEGRSDSVRPDHTPPSTAELRLSNLVEATPVRVFDALTNAAQLDHWSTGGVPTGKARIEPRTGGAFSMGWEGGPDRVLEISPNRRLVLRWPQPQGNLRIAFDLEAKASGTAVYLVSTGYGPGGSAEIPHHRGGWSDLLVCLKNFIEGGDAGFANAYSAQVRET